MALSDFTQYALEGVSINNPTSIDFGADGRLYVTQQNGLIKALEIEKTTDGGYNVLSEEVITLVQSMPNHNDDGSLATNVTGRQVTGVITTTNAEGQIVLYVASSDSRIAGGSSGDEFRIGYELRRNLAPYAYCQRVGEGGYRARPATLGREPFHQWDATDRD